MSNSKTFNGDISNPVFNDGVRELNEAEKRLKEYAKNKTINLNTNAEVKYNTNGQDGFKQVTSYIDKCGDAIAKEFKEPDKEIRKFNKELETLQKNLKNVNSKAGNIIKNSKVEAISKIEKIKDLDDKNIKKLIGLQGNTPFQSEDKPAIIKSNGEKISQKTVWQQTLKNIEKTEFSAEQKKQLEILSKLQKQLNSKKEDEVKIIQDALATEDRQEKTIIKQYEAAVRLNKVLELMNKNRTEISGIVGAKYKEGTIANNWVSKTTIPPDVRKYIDGLKLGEGGDNGFSSVQKELKKLYTEQLESIKTQKTNYETNKKFEEATKIVNDPKYSENLEKQGTDISKQLSNLEQSYSNHVKSLEQSALQSIENYLKVAHKEIENTYDKLATALNSIAKYINADGDLNALSNGVDNILKNNPNLGKSGKGAQIFSDNLEDLRHALTGIEDFRYMVNDCFDEGKLLNPIDTEQIDKTSSDLKEQIEKARNSLKENVELQQTANQYKQLISGNTQDANAQTDGLVNGVLSGIANNEIPVTVTPSIESPQAFVDEITQQLKGHSAKVDVELNKEAITGEAEKIKDLLSKTQNIAVTPVLSEDFDANGFVQSINSKLVGKEVKVDVVPLVDSNDFLKRLTSYSEKTGETITASSNIDGTAILGSKEELAKKIDEARKVAKELEKTPQTAYNNMLERDFSTKNKTEAFEQLKTSAQNLKDYCTKHNDGMFDSMVATSSKAGAEAAYAYFKSYKEAYEKGVADSRLEQVALPYTSNWGDKISGKEMVSMYGLNTGEPETDIISNIAKAEEQLLKYKKEAVETNEKYNSSLGLTLEAEQKINKAVEEKYAKEKMTYELQTALEKYRLASKEIDNVKLLPETDETKRKLQELTKLLENYQKELIAITGLNMSDSSWIKNHYTGESVITGLVSPEDEKAIKNIVTNADATTRYQASNIDYSGLTNILEIIQKIDGAAEKAFGKFNFDFDLEKSRQYALAIKSSVLNLADFNDEMISNKPGDTSYNEAKRDIDAILSRYPELEKFKNVFTDYFQTSDFVKTDEWNNFLATLPQAHKYLESIGYDFEKIKSEQLAQASSGTKLDETAKSNKFQIPVDVVPNVDANDFIQSISSKLTGKEVPIDVVPSDNTDNFLKRLSSYSEKFDVLKNSQKDLENFSSTVTENLKGQNAGINVVPNIEKPQEFASKVTRQLNGVTAKIDVAPQTDNSEAIQREKQALSNLSKEVSQVTTAVDEKTEAFKKEEKTVTSSVNKEIEELNSLSKQLLSVKEDINKVSKAIKSVPAKIDFDVDLSKLNIENIDNASIASFNAFREQLAGLEAQLNASNLSSKLTELSVAFNELSKLKLENLNTKNLNLTPITNFIKKTEDINKLIDTLNALKSCLELLKNSGSFDKDYFSGLKFTPSNVKNMTSMATALDLVAVSLKKFDQEAKDALSSINKLVENAEGLKNLNTIISSPKKVKKAQEVIKNEDKSKEPTDAQKRKAETIDRDFVDGKYHDQVEKLTKRYERLNEVIAVSDNRTGDLRQALEDLRNAHTVEDKIKTFEDFKDAIAIVEGELKNLEKANAGKLFTNDINNQLQGIQEQYKNVPYLSNSLTLLVSKIEQIGNEAKDSSADLTELSKKAEDAFAHFKKGMLPSGDVKGNFDNYDKAVEKARELVASYAKVKTELKVPLQLDDNGIAKMTAQVVDLNGQLKNLTFVYNNASKAMVLQTTDMPPTSAQANKVSVIDEGIASGKYQQEVNELAGRYEQLKGTIAETENKTEELNTVLRELQNAKSVEEKIEAFERFKNVVANVETKLESLENNVNARMTFTNNIEAQLANIQAQYGNVSYLSNSLNTLRSELSHISNKAQESSADLTELGKQAKAAVANFNKGILPSGEEMGNFSSYDKAIAKANELVNSYAKVKTELKTPMQLDNNGIAKMTAQVIDLNGQLKNLTFVYNDASKAMALQTTNVRTELTGMSGVIDSIKHKMKDMMVYWTATFFSPYDFIRYIRNVSNVIIDLNTQMTELAKVSDLSIDQLEKRFEGWANTAKKMGATVSDTISATADWTRLGYSVDEAEKLAEVSILYKNVGDGIDIEAANESLVSTMQGFQLEANQAESVIDSFNEVSNNFAISSAGIGEALQRSASSFYAANTDLNSAIALITATRLKNWLNIWKHILRIYLIAIEVFITMHHNIEETTI